MAALDFDPINNPSGRFDKEGRPLSAGKPNYAWTDWASVFQPHLNDYLRSEDNPRGYTGQRGDAAILGEREFRRQGIINQNPLWAGVTDTAPAATPNLGAVNDGQAGAAGDSGVAQGGQDDFARPIAQASAPDNGQGFQVPPIPQPGASVQQQPAPAFVQPTLANQTRAGTFSTPYGNVSVANQGGVTPMRVNAAGDIAQSNSPFRF